MYSKFLFPKGTFLFEGKTIDGYDIKGEIDTQNISVTTEIIADILWMQTGDFQILDGIIKVNCHLIGVYFPHTIDFEYEDLSISFVKPLFSIEDAKRANKAIGAILEGNQVIITGEKMNLTKVESILKNISWLLEPICSGEVYFGHYVCNDTLIFPEKIQTLKEPCLVFILMFWKVQNYGKNY
ncbi:MAG: hypothetical protein IPL20_05235 [Saprospiraceae bacterium]|nr:hypothetical protein [Saprospiraceae bacterium]